jgi:uncharacterized protein YraI
MEMKKLLSGAAVVLLMSASAQAANDPYDVVVLKTSDGFLALRDGPGTQYSMLSKLHQGDVLIADAKFNGWTHIRETPKTGMTGWVSSKFVQFINDNDECGGC